ncbi:MAG TPA: hypothetical protein VGM27_23435 [Acidobacteriaceae bacterium]|jgi:hypothetical protein
MPNEPSAEVINKLQAATATINKQYESAQALPAPPLKEPTTANGSLAPAGTAGNAVAKYLLVDHYFGATSGTFWGYDGTTWRAASETQPSDEQGLPQVAFASNRVDIYWNASDALTIARCWKYL